MIEQLICQTGGNTEVVGYAPTFVGHLEKIAKACAGWDGADPVRILSRSGYSVPPPA